MTVALYVRFATCPPSNLMRIGPIIKIILATVFFKSRWRQPPFWNLVIMRFWQNSCVLYQICNIPTIFSEDWSHSNEMATDFQNSRWRRFLQADWWKNASFPIEGLYNIANCATALACDLCMWICIFNMTVSFNVRFSTFPPNLVKIGPIVKWRPPNFEIQDVGRRHLQFSYICIFDSTVAFFGRFSTFPPNLVKNGPLVKKWQQIFDIQDGGGSYLEK